MTLWLPKFRFGKNNIDGPHAHLVTRDWRTGKLLTFTTRRACREWIEEDMGYIKHRPDLRAAPHHWLLPVAVKVKIVELDGHGTARVQRQKVSIRSKRTRVRQLRKGRCPRSVAHPDPNAG